MQLNCTRVFIITARRSYASVVLGVVILSVRPSYHILITAKHAVENRHSK